MAIDPRVAFKQSLRSYAQDSEYLERRNRRMQRKAHKRAITQINDIQVQQSANPQPRGSLINLYTRRSAADNLNISAKVEGRR